MTHRTPLLASLAVSTLLLSGCAAAAGSVGAAQAPPSDSSAPAAPAAASPSTASPSTQGGHAGHHGGGSPSQRAAVSGPSEAAKMVCGEQPMDRLTAILDLEQDPHTVNSWADSTFTCTYHLDEGALDISVREAPDQAAALTYFDAMQALAVDATPIEGLANLGLPAYETADGSAVFQKDSFVLHVDASGLPEAMGPDGISRNALAYQLSTTILACWVEHH
ncbi:hypothetical protein [Arthrobacter sp. OY3WO11]|uniref:hypothetical protein n=1 Tax=Arthrobacter sp. OY3WO11 TaxID=1835723 RepID=UPI0007CF7476|nr:hypothetical protein [Arthrobacter sp. OY3WO11]OAE02810.1 hypothetical protein A6A22_16315 [Arthrobacter sp. OY3WO11]